MPLSAKAVQMILRSRLPRGKSWLAFLFARHITSLHSVPITNPEGDTVFVDLRAGTGHHLLAGSEWEPDEAKVMKEIVRQGDVAYDVGGYIGIHSVLLSRLVGANGRVCAFEPNAGVLRLLNKTLSCHDNVKLYQYALADESSDGVLFVPETAEYASLADWTVGRVQDRASHTMCQRRRMDDLLADGAIPLPDFIKCDVEGAEPLVFRGGRLILDRIDAPLVLFESNFYTSRGFNFTVSTAMDFLSSLQAPVYSFFRIDAGGVLSEIRGTDHIHANILAVPLRKLERLTGLTSSADQTSVSA